MDFAAIQAAMNREYEATEDMASDKSPSFADSMEDDEQPDENFGEMLELPFPESVLEKTFKGHKNTFLFLGQYDDSDCKTCMLPCYEFSKRDYLARFKGVPHAFFLVFS